MLAASVGLAWFSKEGWGVWHEQVGYACLALAAARVGWGWLGPRHARFAQFVRSPAATLHYFRLLLDRKEPRYLGHNPLGGWMVVALIVMVFAASASGVLYTTDAFWGVAWVAHLHESLSIALLVLIAVHVAGVAVTSRRHRENLVAAMIHGRKRAPRDGDVG